MLAGVGWIQGCRREHPCGPVAEQAFGFPCGDFVGQAPASMEAASSCFPRGGWGVAPCPTEKEYPGAALWGVRVAGSPLTECGGFDESWSGL